MARLAKYTDEDLINVALDIVRESGIEALSARNLTKRLNTAPATVFTHFESMEAIKQETIVKIREIYNSYVDEGFKLVPPFKGYAMKVIEFAKNEPNMYKVLFMTESDDKTILYNLQNEGHYTKVVSEIVQAFEITEEQAKHMYRNMWIYGLGVGNLIANGVAEFSEQEIATMLGELCKACLIFLNSPQDDRVNYIPRADGVMCDLDSFKK